MTFSPASQARAAWRWRATTQTALTAAAWSSPVAALLLGIGALRVGDPAEIGPLGLISALHPGVYVALAVLTVSFLCCLFRSRPAPAVLLAAHVVVLTVLLFGAATIIEPLPRALPGWLHVGFADYIARTGSGLPELDARFSWPGFFGLVAMVTRVAGLRNAMPLLGWTPVVANLLFGAIVFRLARAMSNDPRSAWLTVWLFLPANWVGQDYFGPQALNYVFYLLLLTVLLLWFRPSPFAGSVRCRHSPRRCSGVLRMVGLRTPPMRFEPEPLTGDTSRVGVIVVALVIFVASTVSHQLTPVAIVVSVAVLVVINRCTVRSLPVLLGVIVTGYVSYFTVTYWSGHLRDILGSFGDVAGTLNHAAIQRVGGDQWHERMVLVRLVLAVVVWFLAAVGAWRRMRRGDGDPALLALTAAPFLLLVLQSYGGEILLRVYALSLPFVAVLLSALLVPVWPPRRHTLSVLLAIALSASLTASFFLARYGNESFEQVRPDDLRAVDWLYEHAQPGTSIVALTSNVPWRSRNIETYYYNPIGVDLGPAEVPAIEREMRRNPRGAFLILTKGQYAFAEVFLGEPPGWGENIERQIDSSSNFTLIYENPGARIYVLSTPKEGTSGT